MASSHQHLSLDRACHAEGVKAQAGLKRKVTRFTRLLKASKDIETKQEAGSLDARRAHAAVLQAEKQLISAKRELHTYHLHSAALLRRMHAAETKHSKALGLGVVADVDEDNDGEGSPNMSVGFSVLESGQNGKEGTAYGPGEMMQQFARTVLKKNHFDSATGSVSGVVQRKCPECGHMNRRICHQESCIQCLNPECGVREPYNDTGVNSLPFGSETDAQPGTYRRSGHLKETWDLMFGIGKPPVPNDVIERVVGYFVMRRMSLKKLLPIEMIREALKDLDLVTYYDSAPIILFRISEMEMPKNDLNVFKLLDIFFGLSEETFVQLKSKGIILRENFTYSPTFRELCALLGFDDYIGLTPPLKTPAKAQRAAELISTIFAHNLWEFINVGTQ
jgi:hypothetical protein